MKRVHLTSCGIASCGQQAQFTTEDAEKVTCKFCSGILTLRHSYFAGCVRLQWLPHTLHGKKVWAACDQRGQLCVEPDDVVTIVYSLPARSTQRYSAHYRNLINR